MPWTYPLAGCRIAHTYRTRSRLLCVGSAIHSLTPGRVRGTSMLIWCQMGPSSPVTPREKAWRTSWAYSERLRARVVARRESGAGR